MQSVPAHAAYATTTAMPSAWEAEAGSSVVQSDTAWLLSFIDILTLLLTLFVLLLAYDRNEQPASKMTLLAPTQAVENVGTVRVPMVETLETRYPLAMPLLVSDWFALLDPVTVSRAESIEALAGAASEAPARSDAEPATAPVAATAPAAIPLPTPASAAAEVQLPAALLPDTAVASPAMYSALPDGEAPMMSPLPTPDDASMTLQPPDAQAVLEILPPARQQETAAAEILLEHFSPALRERVEVSVATGVVNMEITDDILFRPASAALTDAGYTLLDELAGVLSDQSYLLSVEGHTDNVPIQTALFPSNWELSSARAAIVTRSLIARGIAPDRIRAVGYGETRPRADNDSAESRARNRRVSFVLHVE